MAAEGFGKEPRFEVDCPYCAILRDESLREIGGRAGFRIVEHEDRVVSVWWTHESPGNMKSCHGKLATMMADTRNAAGKHYATNEIEIDKDWDEHIAFIARRT